MRAVARPSRRLAAGQVAWHWPQVKTPAPLSWRLNVPVARRRRRSQAPSAAPATAAGSSPARTRARLARWLIGITSSRRGERALVGGLGLVGELAAQPLDHLGVVAAVAAEGAQVRQAALLGPTADGLGRDGQPLGGLDAAEVLAGQRVHLLSRRWERAGLRSGEAQPGHSQTTRSAAIHQPSRESGRRPCGSRPARRAGWGGRTTSTADGAASPWASGLVAAGGGHNAGDVGRRVVVGEERSGQVAATSGAVPAELSGGGVGRRADLVDVAGDAVAVVLPGWAGLAADAELHRPGSARPVRSRAHARQGRAAMVGLVLADQIGRA